MTAPDATLTGRLREALGEHHLDTDGYLYFCGCGHEYGRVERFFVSPDSVEQAMDAHLADVAAQAVAAWLREQRETVAEEWMRPEHGCDGSAKGCADACPVPAYEVLTIPELADAALAALVAAIGGAE